MEDLANAFPFTAYHEWREGVGLPTDVPLGPLVSSRLALRIGRYGEGIQQGAFSSASALPPLVSFGLSPDDHFRVACFAASKPGPLEAPTAVDQDLTFAACTICTCRTKLIAMRQQALRAIKELKARWAGVTERIRECQPPSVTCARGSAG